MGAQPRSPDDMKSSHAEGTSLDDEDSDSIQEGTGAFYIRALKFKEEALGQMHLDTLTSLADLAFVYSKRRRRCIPGQRPGQSSDQGAP